METTKPRIRLKLILSIVAIIILAFIAGISGEFFARFYLSNLSIFSDFYFTNTDNLNQGNIVIREPRKVVVEQDLQLFQVKNDVQNSILGIYKKKKTGKTLLDKIFMPDDYLEEAVVLTSDGWLITHRNLQIRPNESLVSGYNQKNYEIEKVVDDPVAKIMFIKINAQNLPVSKIADLSSITFGQQLVLFNHFFDLLNIVNIKSTSYKEYLNKYDFVNNTEILDKSILLDKSFPAIQNGSPVFNSQSELVGFLTGQNEVYNRVIPINAINPVINQVLKNEKIARPYLGINYLDLSKISGLEQADIQGAKQGAMVWPNEKGVAITADSPLFGKLSIGDIIVSVENQNLDDNNDLTNLLLEY
ncbi:MAG: S1C family serine protease, partial [Candidatus Parcubacteria bacterium]|nr:S1C family serine protease [Candidatus Parcubacteria bacterium]